MSRVLVACVLVLLLAVPRFAAADTKLAYVDMQVVLRGVEDGKLAKARLQKWLDARQIELDQEQESLRKEKEALEKDASSMAADVRVAKAQKLQQRVTALSQKFERFRAEGAEKERKEMEPILAKIETTVARVAEKQNIDFVLEKQSGLVFARAKHDLTSTVIREYNTTR